MTRCYLRVIIVIVPFDVKDYDVKKHEIFEFLRNYGDIKDLGNSRKKNIGSHLYFEINCSECNVEIVKKYIRGQVDYEIEDEYYYKTQ